MRMKRPRSERDVERIAREVAEAADRIVPKEAAYVVLIFGESENGDMWTGYCSTGDRVDVARAMLEHCDKVLST